MSNEKQGIFNANMRSQEKNIRLRFVIVLFIALTAVNFLFADYVKRLDVYNDEYFYLNIAGNIFRGEGAVIDGTNLSFEKVLYSFVLAPFYIIKDAALRVKMISLLNCLMMSSSLFPVWLISRKIGLSRNNTFWALIITCVFPELSMSMSFMAENLFFPLVLLFMYFLLVNWQSPTKRNGIILGVLGFLCYFCKESFLAIFVSCVGFEIVFPVISYWTRGKSERKSLKSFYCKNRFINLMFFCVTFAALSIVLKLLMFHGAEGSYQVKSAASFFESYRIWYAVYAAVYYIAGLMISALILPFVYPIIRYKDIGENAQRLFCFTVMSVLAMTAVVVYMITIYEDYGMSTPRVHTRYFSDMILILFIVFLKSTEGHYDSGDVKRPRYLAGLALACVLPCMIYRGMAMGVPDQTLLGFYEDYRSGIGMIEINSAQWLKQMISDSHTWMLHADPLKINVAAVLFGAAVFVLIFFFHFMFTKKHEKYARLISLSAILIIMTSNSLNARNQWKARNNDKFDLVSEVANINDYLRGSSEKFNILFLTGGKYGNHRLKTIDTYLTLKKNQHIFTVHTESIDLQKLSDNGFVIESIDLDNVHINGKALYSKNDISGGFDYILTDGSSNLNANRLFGVEEVYLPENDEFTLYKNLDPKTLIIDKESESVYSGGTKTLWSLENGSTSYISADYIVTDNGILDVNDVLIKANIPADQKLGSVNVHVELENELDTYQLCVIRQNGKDILDTAVKGEGEVNFTIDIMDGMASFDILLVNVRIDLLGHSGTALLDETSCRVKSIVISDQ